MSANKALRIGDCKVSHHSHITINLVDLLQASVHEYFKFPQSGVYQIQSIWQESGEGFGVDKIISLYTENGTGDEKYNYLIELHVKDERIKNAWLYQHVLTPEIENLEHFVDDITCQTLALEGPVFTRVYGGQAENIPLLKNQVEIQFSGSDTTDSYLSQVMVYRREIANAAEKIDEMLKTQILTSHNRKQMMAMFFLGYKIHPTTVHIL